MTLGPFQEETPGTSYPKSLVAGGTLAEPLDFEALSVRVSNPPGGQWLRVGGEYIAPGTGFAVVNLPGVSEAEAEWAAPPGVVQPPAVPGLTATLRFYSIWLPPSPGVSVTSIAAIGASGVSTPVVGFAAAPAATVLDPGLTPVSYQVVPVNAAGQDGPPSAVTVASSAPFLANNHPNVTLSITPVVGAAQYRILRQGRAGDGYSGNLEVLAGANPLPIGTLKFTDKGAAGVLYNPATAQVLAPVAVTGSGGTFDVSDRPGRLLGIIASIAAAVDISDRVARLLGVADVSDRAARLLGVVASITAAVDVSDRAGRLLGVVASITAAVDVSDRAARALGAVSAAAGATWDVSDRALRSLGIVSSQPLDGARATYVASGNTAVATAATDFVTLTASGTKKVRILRVAMSSVATAGAMNFLSLIKRSTADTGGTSAAVTPVPHEATDAAATAAVLQYTANPTGLGTTVGIIRNRRALTQAVGATTGPMDPIEWLFGDRPSKALVLPVGGTTNFVLSLAGLNAAGTVVAWEIEWTEE